MNIKLKTSYIRTWKKTFISQHIFHQHWYTCLVALPVHRSRSTVVSATSAPPFQPIRHQRNVYHVSWPSCEPLYAINTSHRKQEIFRNKYPLQWVILPTKESRYRTLFFGSTHLKDGRHFDYCNQPLNMRMRVCYLDCHKAGLCYYLVIHIENLLRPLELFYLHLWRIYWLSLVFCNYLLTNHLIIRRGVVYMSYSQGCCIIWRSFIIVTWVLECTDQHQFSGKWV
jgi:hypothetical protein